MNATTSKLLLIRMRTSLARLFRKRRAALRMFLARRPHRSFRRTRRRDYIRSLKLPGYVGLTLEVTMLLRRNMRLFLGLALTYGVLLAIFVGLASQGVYSQLSDTLDKTGQSFLSGGWAAIGKAGLLLVSGVAGSFTPNLSEVQQVYSVLLVLLIWLTSVWLIRSLLAGKKPRLRDGLYNGGSPIVATGIVSFIMTLQCIPAALAILLYIAAKSSDVLSNGFIAMTATTVMILLIILSLYWVISSVFALIIVTLPGMYPWQAIKASGDIVVGRRTRILLRILWLLVIDGVVWSSIVLFSILIDRGMKQVIGWFEYVPFVPIMMAAVTSAVVVFSASYVYLFYRKVVDDDAAPA